MKRIIISIIGILILSCHVAFAYDSSTEPSAEQRIYIYDQGGSLAHSQGSTIQVYHGRVGWASLAKVGCGFYTHLHAFQWLTGIGATTTTSIDLINQLKNGVAATAGKEAWDCRGNNGEYIAYFKQFGINKSTPSMNINSLTSHFSKGGVIKVYTPDGGTHFNLAVGMVYDDIDNNGSPEYWVHIVDSAAQYTMKVVEKSGYTSCFYSFSDHSLLTASKLQANNKRNGNNANALEYWLKYDVFSKYGISTGYVPETPPDPMQIYSVISYEYNGFYKIISGQGNLKEYPYEDANIKKTLRVNILDKDITRNDIVEVTAIVKNSYNNQWAKLSDGSFIYFNNLEYLYKKVSDFSQECSCTQNSIKLIPFADSQNIKLLSGNEKLNLIAKYMNKYGNTWYEVDTGGFVNENNISIIQSNIPVSSILLNSTAPSISVGDTYTLIATVSPSNATNKKINWSSNNTSIANVDSNGKITAKNIGTATITATAADGSGVKKTATVTIKAVSSSSTSDISINNILFPWRYSLSSKSFEWVSGSGSISASAGLASVTFNLYHKDGSLVSTYTVNPNTTELQASSVNTHVKFSQLNKNDIGRYSILEIIVIDQNGKSLSASSGIEVISSGNNSTTTLSRSYTDIPALIATTSYGNSEYKLYKASYSWEEAKNYAQSAGSYLACITSAEENNVILGLMSNINETSPRAWIGGRNEKGIKSWISGEPFSYTNWDSDDSEPSTGVLEQCIAMRENGKWSDGYIASSNYNYFVVEIERDIPVTSIAITAPSLTLNIGNSLTLTTEVSPSNASNKDVIWSSSNSNTATIDYSGRVTAKAPGTVTITATAVDGSGITGIITIIIASIPTERIELNVNALSMIPGDTYQVLATIHPSDATYRNCKWQSSDTSVATVSDSGLIIAVSSGTVNIVCRAEKEDDILSNVQVTVYPIHGTCGNSVTWRFEDGTLVISGTGAMEDYSISVSDIRPWAHLASKITNVVVEEGITSLGISAFESFSSLTSVSLPNSLITISSKAFRLCEVLPSIYIPDSVTSIEGIAFDGCYALSSVHLPSNLSILSYRTFHNCYKLASITIPDSVTTISFWAFLNCKSLSNINVPDSVISIEYGAFKGCTNLTSITLPKTLTSINYDLFDGCISLQSIDLPESIISIGYRAFEDCHSLTSIYIPANVSGIDISMIDGEIKNGAFTNCSNDLIIYCYDGSIAHEYSLNYGIGYCLLDTPITSPDFILPAALTTIESEAFANISAKRVKLSENVIRIESGAFADCPNLYQIYIPQTATYIDSNAFSGISALTIYGIEGSYADYYAYKNGYDFVAIE